MNNENRKKLSLVIPCFNESQVLPIFYEEVTKVLLATGGYELLFVDDGSQDDTLDIIINLAKKDDKVYYLSFSRNFGKEAAIYAGLCNAEGEYVAVMDADMQDPPAMLPEMMKILQNDEYDSVATRRMNRKGSLRYVPGLHVNFINALIKSLMQILWTGQEISE